MSARIRHLIVAAAFVVGVTTAGMASAQANIGISLQQCMSGTDSDHDGYSDACELLLARAFAPEMVFHHEEPEETQAMPRPVWVVQPNPDAPMRETGRAGVRILYMPSYLRDPGTPERHLRSHSGDTEFIAIDAQLNNDGNWEMTRALLSSHHRTWNHQTADVGAANLEPAQSNTHGPRVYVSNGKHGNFRSVADCSAALLADKCDQEGTAKVFNVQELRNLGSADYPSLDSDFAMPDGTDCVVPDAPGCHEERYWSGARFCGWQDDVTVCPDGANSWEQQLRELLMPTRRTCGYYQACCLVTVERCTQLGTCESEENPCSLSARATAAALSLFDNEEARGFCEDMIATPTWVCDLEPPAPPSNTAFSTGDPHLLTFDGVRYDPQPEGELILSRHTGGFEVQIRTQQWGTKNVAVTIAVAARVVHDIVAIDPDGTVRVNGVRVELPPAELLLPSGGAIFQQGDMYTIVWPDGPQLEVESRRSYLNVRISMPDEMAGELDGLLGNFDDENALDLVSRDGEPLDDRPTYEAFYGQYIESWRVSQEESLFYYRAGEDTEYFTDRSFPRNLATTGQLSREEYDSAFAVCQLAGVSNEWMDACVLDRALTEIDEVGDDLAAVPDPVRSVQIQAPACPGLALAEPLCGAPDVECGSVTYSCNGTYPDCDCSGVPLAPPAPTSCATHADCLGGLCVAMGCDVPGTCAGTHSCDVAAPQDPVCGCNGVTYASECDALAAGNVGFTAGECPPLNLLAWSQEGVTASGNWQVAVDGLSVLQTINGDPTFFVSTDSFIDTTIEGAFRVQTTSDDDFIGFVIGYRAPIASEGDATNQYDLILFDWKQADQPNGSYTALEGFTLTRINGTYASVVDPYWGHTGTGVEVLASSYGSTLGWADNTEYLFRVTYESDRIRIYIDDALIFDVAGEFEPGRFGFYNYSQEQVRYSDFLATAAEP